MRVPSKKAINLRVSALRMSQATNLAGHPGVVENPIEQARAE
jgi:hypothetical protein